MARKRVSPDYTGKRVFLFFIEKIERNGGIILIMEETKNNKVADTPMNKLF